MRCCKGIAIAATLLMVYGWPVLAEADGNHIHVGELHFDPIVGGAVAVFVGFFTLMFVGQWVRFNAARRRAAGSDPSEELPEKGEEAANGIRKGDDGQRQGPGSKGRSAGENG